MKVARRFIPACAGNTEARAFYKKMLDISIDDETVKNVLMFRTGEINSHMVAEEQGEGA